MKIVSAIVPNSCPCKTLDDLMRVVLAIIPNAQFDFDKDRQIIIYTDLKAEKDGQIIPFEVND